MSVNPCASVPYRVSRLPDAAAINRQLRAGFEALAASADVVRSHFFAGRYENLYVPRERLPALEPLLGAACRGAADFLGQPQRELAVGFWFNCMQPGELTQPHRHDEDDELVSGVYYVEAPPACGDLVLRHAGLSVRVRPVAGQFVFFPPDLLHEVEENRSGATRLSIGMNFGPRRNP